MSDASGPAVGPDALRELAHRLRSPLGVIQGYASLLEDHLSANGDESAEQWARLVGEEVDVLNALLSDLSRWTTLESKPPTPSAISLRDLLGEVAEGTRRATAAELTVEGEDLRVAAEPALLRRALLHLIRPFGSKPVARLNADGVSAQLRLEGETVRSPEIKAQDPWLAYARAVVRAQGGDVAWDVRGATVTLPSALAE